jgi:hypothetical protein
MSKPAIVALNAATPPGVFPSRALVSAALAGLLCAATPACNSTPVDDGTEPMTGPTGGVEGASGGAQGASGGASNAGGRATTGGTSTVSAGGNPVPSNGGTGSGGRAESEAGATPDASASSTGAADAGSVFPQPGDAGVECHTDGGPPAITSSKIVRDLTLERFTADCDTWHGVVQIPPHCGGFNSCRGMSYDSGTEVLTEHTCRGLSSCAGFSCVLCPP